MRILAVAVAVFIAALFISPTSASNTVSVVYFYPRDQEPNLEYPVDAIMADVQDWYGTQVGSTFSVSPAQVVRGKKTAAQYQDNIWGDILRELGYYCGTGVHVIFVHPSIGFTGGGSCTPDYQSGDGTAMVEEGLHTGIVAHELGHAFSLPHSTCESVMWCWWDYPDVGLLDVEVSALQAYFDPEPGEPKTCKPKYNPHGRLVGAKRCR